MPISISSFFFNNSFSASSNLILASARSSFSLSDNSRFIVFPDLVVLVSIISPVEFICFLHLYAEQSILFLPTISGSIPHSLNTS